MQARLIHRLRRREAVKSWLRLHLNLPFHSKGTSSFLSKCCWQHLFDYFTNLGWPNNFPFFLPSFLETITSSPWQGKETRLENPYIHVLVGDSKAQNVKLMVEEVFLLPLRLMSLLAPDFFFFLSHNKQCVALVWILSQCSGPFLRDVGWKCSFQGTWLYKSFSESIGHLGTLWSILTSVEYSARPFTFEKPFI